MIYNTKKDDNIYDKYITEFLTKILNTQTKTQAQLDEEILDKMDLKNIENYLRKKKLKNISK
jgi:hypothetical protein